MDFNQVLASAKTPIWEQQGKYTYLLLDPSGRIIHLWRTKFHFLEEDVLLPISRSGNIFKCFDFGEVKSLDEMPRPNQVFYALSGFFNCNVLPGFYTALPICTLGIVPLKEERFLGMIALSEFLPNIFNPGANAMVLVSGADALKGFNECFYGYFREQYPDPGEMLNLPCSAFFSPNPLQIQSEFFSRFKHVEGRFPNPSFRLTRKSVENKEIEWDPLGRLDWIDDGWQWENTTEQGVHLTFLHPVDAVSSDLCLEAEITALKGDPPLMVLGDRKEPGNYIDSRGYTSGIDVYAKRPFLKRYGYLTVQSRIPARTTEGPITFRLEKTGAAFLLKINGQEALRYYDFESISKSPAYFSLYLRPGCCARIKTAAVFTAEKPAEPENQDLTIRLSLPKPAHFTLSRFYNNSLQTNFPDVEGYLLRDVTLLQEGLRKYRDSYRQEKQEGERLRALLTGREGDAPLLGESAALRSIRGKADTIAHSSATVLIQGETGTGKEVLAKHIHGKSPYAAGPFIKVDCSTLAPTLVESELFGHEKGAFTGALQLKKGKFEQADNGTLFIDEISNLSREIQAKLLSFLQDLAFTRVGGTQPVRLKTRVILASNLPLEEMVRKELFREDLFFRINIINLRLPPLRERMEDLPVLCDYFIEVFNAQYGKCIRGLSGAAYRKLHGYGWPGNVRELRNVVYHAVLFCDGGEINEDLIHLPEAASSPAGRQEARKIRPGIKREALLSMLKKNNGNVKKTARDLSMSRQTVYYHMGRHKINPGQIRAA